MHDLEIRYARKSCTKHDWIFSTISNPVPVHAFHKFKYGSKISDKENGYIKEGVIFGTYASLIGERHHDRMKTTKMGKILKVRVKINPSGP